MSTVVVWVVSQRRRAEPAEHGVRRDGRQQLSEESGRGPPDGDEAGRGEPRRPARGRRRARQLLRGRGQDRRARPHRGRVPVAAQPARDRRRTVASVVSWTEQITVLARSFSHKQFSL